MLKQIATAIFLLLTFCCSAQSNKPFALLKDNKVLFTIDTVSYKRKLESKLFSDKKVVLSKIEIVKQKSLVENSDFYYILLTSKDKKIKVARWLIKAGTSYYVNDELEEGVLFEQSYLICEGGDNCSPQVYIDGETRRWGCSKTIACYADGQKPECLSIMTYIEP